MKRIFMFSLGALLVISSTALAGRYDQDKNERPRRITLPSSGFLGIEIDEVTSEAAGRLRLGQERGALITGVTDDTAAAKAGLRKDDVIIKWNGEAIESARELSRHLYETPAGRSVKLGVLRNGSEMMIAVTLGERGDYRRMRVERIAPRAYVARPASIARVRQRDGYHLGISLQSMSPQLAEYFGLQNRNGALVTFVHPDSAAAKAGIKAGDVILAIGGETVENPLRVVQTLRDKGEGAVEVTVMRDRQQRRVTVQLEKGKTSFNWSADDDADVIVAEALTEPFVIGPIHLKPLRLAPIVVPQLNLAPVVVPQIRVAPMVAPRMVIPKINMPKLLIPPMPPVRIVMPDMTFRIQV